MSNTAAAIKSAARIVATVKAKNQRPLSGRGIKAGKRANLAFRKGPSQTSSRAKRTRIDARTQATARILDDACGIEELAFIKAPCWATFQCNSGPEGLRSCEECVISKKLTAFAELSNYLDDELDDSSREELEKGFSLFTLDEFGNPRDLGPLSDTLA